MNVIDVKPGSAPPTIAISRDSLASLVRRRSPALDRTFFTHRSFLDATGVRDIVSVSMTVRGAVAAELLFVDDGGHLRCCNRTDDLPDGLLMLASETLFRRTDAGFIVFEDVVLDDPAILGRRARPFSYQENWRRSIGPQTVFLSSRQAGNLRRKGRRLAEFLGAAPAFAFRRCTPDDIEQVVGFNARTLESKGRKHRFAAAERVRFKAVAADCGYLAGLFAGDRLIAGDIVCVTGREAYFNLVGYDMDFERFSPGMQVHVNALAECVRHGCTRANFLWGNSRWKSDLGGVRVPLTTVIVRRDGRSVLDPAYLSTTAHHLERIARARLRRSVDAVRDLRSRLPARSRQPSSN